MNDYHRNKLLIIISSPSGAGKTSVCKKIIEKDDSITLSISDTTRPARDNEINGKDYNFINEDQFKSRILSKSYIEHAKVFGNYYGSLYKNIDYYFSHNKDVLFDIDWQGTKQLKNSLYSNILSIFIIPPSKKIIHERLIRRAKTSGDNEDSINDRMKKYETEMSHKDDYDHIVINDNLDECVKQILSIIAEKRKLIH